MDYEKQIRELISGIIKTTEPIDNYGADNDLQSIGMDSLTFVRIVVEIENRFEIEFPDDKLVMTESGTINQLCAVILTSKGELI